MTGKERVRCVLEGKIPDKVPFGEFAVDYDTVERILGHETYLRAKAKSRIAFWEGRRDEVVQSWKEDLVELYHRLDCLDLVNLSPLLVPPRNYQPAPPRRIDETTWIDDANRVYKYSEITADITMVHDPAEWTREFKEEDFTCTETAPPDSSVFEVIDHAIEHLGKDWFILGPSGGEVGMLLLGGMQRGLTEYLLHPEVVEAAYRQALREADTNDAHYIRPGVDAVIWGQDFAYNSGPMISPAMFRRFCLPAIKERAGKIKTAYGKYVIKHACGNNWQLLGMFLEAGYDCYQSIQPSAGMDLGELKKRFGDRLCLWGGMPVEHLVSGSREEVAEDVRRAVAQGAPGGRYIFGSSHSIAVGTKYDNFLTMLDEFEKADGMLLTRSLLAEMIALPE